MLTTRRDQNILHIALDDGKANALGIGMLRALLGALRDSQDADAVLLTGRPKIFCGGLNLNEITTLDRIALSEFMVLFHDVFHALFTLDRPLVAAVHGGAVAGGAIVLCSADLRLGADDAGIVGVNETRLGLPFPTVALEIVRFALDQGPAHRALVLGELFDKKTALAMGFLQRLLPTAELDAAALAATHDAAKASRSAVAHTKAALRAQALVRIDAVRGDHNAFIAAWTSADAQRRIADAMAALKKK